MAKRKTCFVIGGGAREHAIAWTMRNAGAEVHCAPGNAGIAEIATCVPIGERDIRDLSRYALDCDADLTIVGEAASLVAGIADRLAQFSNHTILGPTKLAARLEGSKVFAKRFMARHGIPTAPFRVFDDFEKASAYIRSRPHDLPVVKADGLCGGKGVVVPDDLQEALRAIADIMRNKKFGGAGDRVVLEDRLKGIECSFTVVTDGVRALPFASAKDYKRRFAGDAGPMTGGMGCVAPHPLLTPLLEDEVIEMIILPALRGMSYEGAPYRGILYVGLMLTDDGPKVLEFNVRFGDPEASVILPVADFDPFGVFIAAAEGDLRGYTVRAKERAAVCKVLVAGSYPEGKSSGEKIAGLREALSLGALLFHAGVARNGSGAFVTSGGRIVDVVCLGETIPEARRLVEDAAARVRFGSVDSRDDIASEFA